jgi:hypothetical protein
VKKLNRKGRFYLFFELAKGTRKYELIILIFNLWKNGIFGQQRLPAIFDCLPKYGIELKEG